MARRRIGCSAPDDLPMMVYSVHIRTILAWNSFGEIMRLLTAVVLFLVSASAFPDTVTRVIDTGPGLATVT